MLLIGTTDSGQVVILEEGVKTSGIDYRTRRGIWS